MAVPSSERAHELTTPQAILLNGLIALAGSIVANLVIRWVAQAALNPAPEFNPLASMGPVILFTSIGVVLAVIVFWITARYSRAPLRTFRRIALLAFLFSLLPDIMMVFFPYAFPFGGITVGAAIVLMLMHVAAWLITVWALTRGIL